MKSKIQITRFGQHRNDAYICRTSRECYDSPPKDECIEEDERLKNLDPKLIEMIRSEIMDHGKPVAWDDIAGLDFAKKTIQVSAFSGGFWFAVSLVTRLLCAGNCHLANVATGYIHWVETSAERNFIIRASRNWKNFNRLVFFILSTWRGIFEHVFLAFDR